MVSSEVDDIHARVQGARPACGAEAGAEACHTSRAVTPVLILGPEVGYKIQLYAYIVLYLHFVSHPYTLYKITWDKS